VVIADRVPAATEADVPAAIAVVTAGGTVATVAVVLTAHPKSIWTNS
jgi:hypothetical protein